MKRGIGIVILLWIIIFSSTSVLALRINEVELNPAGTDKENEWVEFYSQNEVNLDGWHIRNVKEKNFYLNGSFSGYFSIITPYNFLANDKQKLSLYNGDELIDETSEITDSKNDDFSWQLCDKWVFAESSRNKKNNCPENKEEVVKDEEKNDKEIVTTKIIEEKIVQNTSFITSEVIKLEPKGLKEWKSKSRYIKEYSIYGFTLFLIIILIGVIYKNARKNRQDV